MHNIQQASESFGVLPSETPQKNPAFSWKEKRTNLSILDGANIHSITSIITKHQLRWTGHVTHTRLPKQVLYSQLSIGHRSPGGQKKIYKDNMRTNLKK